jgi:predicted metal-dependent phosphoesterase TrpH
MTHKIPLWIKKVSIHLIVFICINLCIIGICVPIYMLGPAPSIYKNEDWIGISPISPPGHNASQWNVVLDQHSHTIRSSDARLTLEQNVLWHIALGYNVICITDHNIAPDLAAINSIQSKYAGKIIIIPGVEWTTDRIHLNVLGITEWDVESPWNPSDEQIQAIIEKGHRQGGVVSVNHIPRNPRPDYPTRDQLFSWGIDFLEVINCDNYPEAVYDQESHEFCQTHIGEIGEITGSDMHMPDRFGSGGIHGWTILNATNFTYTAVMEELRAHNTKILLSPYAIVDPASHIVNPLYLGLKPLMNIGQIFVGLYSTETGLDSITIIIGLGYYTLLFIALEIVRFIGARIQQKKR